MKKAKLIYSEGRSTNDFVWTLRMGEKGKGGFIHRVLGWRNSPQSLENAERIIRQVAEKNDLEVIWD